MANAVVSERAVPLDDRAGGAGGLARPDSRVAELLALAWAWVPDELLDSGADPGAVMSYVDSDVQELYWELHCQDGRVRQTDLLHRVDLSVEPPPTASPDPVRQFLRSWYQTGDTGIRCARWAWLEVDGPLVCGRVKPIQGVSICLDPTIGCGGNVPSQMVVHPPDAICEVFARLQRACQQSPEKHQALREVVIAAERHGGVVRHLSLMRGRQASPTKAYVALPKTTLRAFLRSLRWDGDVERAVSVGEQVCRSSERTNIDLELTDRLSPRIGFEVFGDPDASVDPSRVETLTWAAAGGWLSTKQTTALARWAGSDRRLLGGERWPTRLQRRLDLKFVLHPEHGDELKAYLGFRREHCIF
jgi:hypothetical protein